ncbi:MAG: hypothetical protein A2015_12695 [Spirochaetes bacterium GWF1_31_7]|nr:MAG: hypothetical protein A2Y30_10485 [Spirochaetes bacterium GWE1_32_154]OHD49240.1 MAG: hypothetical protein A2Y29_16115 [Spirochaetes bacterium GWE2_31_10]OHD51802.1 MAG: hypothetical protein A2015_12695 [Spirochaetes bacterium GWF1_31_7]OHD80169.1 MAG: hypothetical protein A2355_05870 [Spirochaetes bacterium RIFOXYB1_FULL_32_8]HBD95340.1 hypothetical protein [Spirochaetia bacterium]
MAVAKNKNLISSDQENNINKFSLYVLWGTMIFGVTVYTISRISQHVDITILIKNIVLFLIIFGSLNIVSTLAFLFIKKHKVIVKYCITTTYALILPLYSYVSLGTNHQTSSIGLVVLIFSILHMRVDLVVYAGVLLYSLDTIFVYTFRETIIPTLFNPRSELVIRATTYVMSTVVAVFITNLINKVFKAVLEKEIEVADDKNALEKTLGVVRDLSSTLKKIGGENTEFSEKLSDSSENQASSVEQIASSTEQLMSSIEEINKNALMASDEMTKIVSASKNGMASLQSSTKEMLELVKFSKIMLESIESINDIAENTNLLALNAAIEAARAGEAGKGFAVVATEIRKLAEKSTSAASNVSNLLRESEIKITNSSSFNEQVSSIYHDIVNKLENISKVFQQISFATQELDKGGREISKGLEVINQASNENFGISKQIENLTKSFDKELRRLSQITGVRSK